MARDFDGSTQYGTLTLNTAQKAITSGWSLSWWEYLDANGQYKRPYHMAAGAFAYRMEFDDGWGYVFVDAHNSADGKWSIAKPSTGSWHQIGVTFDGSSTANDPLMYLNGVSQAVTERASPSGTSNAPDGTLTIADATGGGQKLNGRLAEMAWWNRILTAGEMAALGKGFSPAFFPRGRILYLPMFGNNSPELELMSGSNMTLTGSPAKIEHPRIIYPANFGSMFTAAAAVSTALKDIIGVGVVPFAR